MTKNIGKFAKLAPCYCEPFVVLKCIGSFIDCLNFPTNIKFHHIIHVNHFKVLLVSNNTIDIECRERNYNSSLTLGVADS